MVKSYKDTVTIKQLSLTLDLYINRWSSLSVLSVFKP